MRARRVLLEYAEQVDAEADLLLETLSREDLDEDTARAAQQSIARWMKTTAARVTLAFAPAPREPEAGRSDLLGELTISYRAFGVLTRAGIDTISEAQRRIDDGTITAARGVGPGTIAELCAALAQHYARAREEKR